MPNFSGIWTITQQMQAVGASTWARSPAAPTIGTATAGNAQASVTFTAPSCTGYPATITGYQAVSTPGCITATGASSPITVTGLTNCTAYTFKVQAQNGSGYGALSAASNSVTPILPTCQAYTTAGTYSFVVPTGVTSIAAVVVGGGSSGAGQGGGGGGALSYANAISVTPGETLTAVVGAGGASVYGPNYGKYGGVSRLHRSGTNLVSVVQWTGCSGGSNLCYQKGQTVGVGTGGVGGAGAYIGAGGAGGYSGAGGAGGVLYCGVGGSGSGGGGGGGNGSGYANAICCVGYITGGGGGGGVGIYGQGSNGAGGNSPVSSPSMSYIARGGGGGSGGTDGGSRGISCAVIATGGSGGLYGGGGGGVSNSTGGSGAVRIVWAGGSRGTPSFPSTNVGA